MCVNCHRHSESPLQGNWVSPGIMEQNSIIWFFKEHSQFFITFYFEGLLWMSCFWTEYFFSGSSQG